MSFLVEIGMMGSVPQFGKERNVIPDTLDSINNHIYVSLKNYEATVRMTRLTELDDSSVEWEFNTEIPITPEFERKVQEALARQLSLRLSWMNNGFIFLKWLDFWVPKVIQMYEKPVITVNQY